MIYELLI